MPEKKKPVLTRDELDKEIAYLLDLPYLGQGQKNSKSYHIVNTILKVVTDALIRGESISIPGFGIFKWHETPPRRRIQAFPYNGKPPSKSTPRSIESIPAKRRVIFKPSKVLSRMLNGN